jgi:hypothetical protein
VPPFGPECQNHQSIAFDPVDDATRGEENLSDAFVLNLDMRQAANPTEHRL